METLVLPAEDQFVLQRDKAQRRNASAKKILQQEPRSHGSEKSSASHQVNFLQNETSCSFSPDLPKACRPLKPALPASSASLPSFPSSTQGFTEGYSGLPGRKWHSMPCNLPGGVIVSSFQERDEGVGVPPHPFQFRQTKHENGKSWSRSDAKNRKRTAFRSKPLEIGTHNGRIARSLEGNTFGSSYGVKMKKDSCAFSPPISVTENWAGPAYSCSPPPSSLPFPKFSMQQRRCVSLELPPVEGEFSEAVSDAALLVSSQSAPTSPSGKAPVVLQDFGLDVVSATKDLRRILNLDFDD